LANIFVSYASEDRTRIEPLVAALEAAGYSVWWDGHLRGGSMFSKEIETELKAAHAVVVVWTEPAVNSRWVADEAELALRSNKLVPICLDDLEPPIGFRQIQTIDFASWSAASGGAEIQTLIEAVAHLVGPTSAAAQSLQTQDHHPPNASIAVLPFVNMSSDPEQEYFSDGITEELLNLLAKIKGMRVTARTSSFKFKETKEDIQEIGRLLGVAHVLEGSVRKAGNRVRITAQLVNILDGFHMWSETFDRTLDDIFAIQDEISAAIVDALKEHILDDRATDLPKADRGTNVEAYDHYLKGHFLIQGTTLEVIEQGLDELRTAIRIDPSFALAHADFGDALAQLISYGNYQNQAIIAEARDAAFKAVKLGPDLAEAHSAIASVHEFITLDWSATDAAYEKAISLSSQSPIPYHRYAEYLWLTLRLERACEMARRSLEIDPLDGNAMHGVGITEFMAGDFTESVNAFGKWNSLYPDSRWSYIKHALALAFDGQYDASFKQAEAAGQLSEIPLTSPMDVWLGWAHLICGRNDLYEAARDRTLRASMAENAQHEMSLFYVYCIDGDDDAFMKLLIDMAEARHPHTCGARLPLLDHLRFPVTAKLRARDDYWDHLKKLDLPPSQWAVDPRQEVSR
jgi:adenylate cyclase